MDTDDTDGDSNPDVKQMSAAQLAKRVERAFGLIDLEHDPEFPDSGGVLSVAYKCLQELHDRATKS